jgi:hypothetical protein
MSPRSVVLCQIDESWPIETFPVIDALGAIYAGAFFLVCSMGFNDRALTGVPSTRDGFRDIKKAAETGRLEVRFCLL